MGNLLRKQYHRKYIIDWVGHWDVSRNISLPRESAGILRKEKFCDPILAATQYFQTQTKICVLENRCWHRQCWFSNKPVTIASMGTGPRVDGRRPAAGLCQPPVRAQSAFAGAAGGGPYIPQQDPSSAAPHESFKGKKDWTTTGVQNHVKVSDNYFINRR